MNTKLTKALPDPHANTVQIKRMHKRTGMCMQASTHTYKKEERCFHHKN